MAVETVEESTTTAHGQESKDIKFSDNILAVPNMESTVSSTQLEMSTLLPTEKFSTWIDETSTKFTLLATPKRKQTLARSFTRHRLATNDRVGRLLCY